MRQQSIVIPVDKLFIALRSLLNAYDSAQIGTLVNWAQQT